MTGNVVQRIDDWTPARHGVFFGSAACCHGRLCTLSAYEQATREAKALVRHLGPGWEAVVHENLGWFYKAILRSGENVIEVNPHTTGEHAAGGWKVTGYGATFNYRPWHNDKTPEGAVIKVVAALRAEMDALGAVLSSATALPALSALSAASRATTGETI